MKSSGVRYGNLGPLREVLAEAARTDESNAEQTLSRFVELRPGIHDTLGARRHHLIAGRRGTGKSTLLHYVRSSLRDAGIPVAVVDMENFKGRQFPDVLIEILIALLNELRPKVHLRTVFQDLRLKRRFSSVRHDLENLLRDPQSLTKKLEKNERQGRRLGGEATVGVGRDTGVPLGSISAGTSASRSSISVSVASAEYEELKIERLQEMASRLSSELVKLVDGSREKKAVVFIDDFYFVKLSDQASVLDYLHQVVKNTGIWLKIGGVGTRMKTFRDSDPPLGMQLNQDIDPLTIDVTLSDFNTAQRFLEQMMDGVLGSLDVSTRQLFTDAARTRMVLACGGAVARDYITLTATALDAAVERLNKQDVPSEDTIVNLQAEDVNIAARQRLNGKEDEELSQDAGTDAQRLRERWQDIHSFVREQGSAAFVLFEQKHLESMDWGEEVRQLENLRLLHRIKDAVPNTLNWRGVKVVVYMVDLGQVAVQRLRTAIPPFWQSTAEFDKLRRAEWVYTPDWRTKVVESTEPGKAKTKSGQEVESNDQTHFDLTDLSDAH